MSDVIIYTTDYCGYCLRAKSFLARKGVPFREIDVTHDDDKRAWLVRATGRRTVPQVFIAGKPVGGYDDLVALERAGALDGMLQEQGDREQRTEKGE